MSMHNSDTYDRAKALIAELSKAGLIPAAMFIDGDGPTMKTLYDIVLKHIASAKMSGAGLG